VRSRRLPPRLIFRRFLADERVLLRYALPYWRGWAAIVVVTLLSTFFSLLQPWPLKILVDNVLGGKTLTGLAATVVGGLPAADSTQGLLAWVVIAGLVVFAIDSLADVLLTFAWIRVGQRMVYDLATDLFARIQRRSLLFHARNSVGDSMSRVTGDSWAVHTIVDTLLFAPLHAGITTIGVLAVMLRMDAGLTLASLAVAPLMVGSSLVFGRPIREAGRTVREVESRLQSHVQRTLSGIAAVQAFGQERREEAQLRELTRRAVRAQQRSTLVGSANGLIVGLIGALGTGLIIWIAANRVLDGRLTVGELLVFLAYLGTLQTQLKTFTGIYAALQGVGASVDRVMDVLGVAPEVADRPRAVPLPVVRGQVRFEEVTFGYESGRAVLRGVSLEARPGEMVAIVGPTGAGKTTLVSLVPRFFDAWQGSILIDGRDVRDVRLRELRAQIALVPQEPFLFPLSVAENIAYGRPGASRAEVEAAARAANAHDFIEELDDGYDTVLGERGATLSGGQRQRLAIARALLRNAPILILDEPTSALDAETEAGLLEALDRLMVGRTTFVIAHRLSTIRRADRIVVLRDGEVVEAGTHAELLGRRSLYARLHALQVGTAATAGGAN
jgi:ATP-binding cassette subfamily B protein/subfamily B ATP-binding cassette protein MsbA